MIKAPFPYFGGKSRVANIIWSKFGYVSNYVEPFAGSLAVLLANPKIPKVETVNDKDNMICNFWRAISNDPESVIKYADYPVIETDLHSRQRYIINNITKEFSERLELDDGYFDAKIAGYWVWGISSSIGNNWLNDKGLKALPLLSSAGGGINGLKFDIKENFKKLQDRLRRVRVICGDWKRAITPSITYKNKGAGDEGITGLFLDPPYLLSDRDKVYKNDENIYSEVCNWAINNANDKMRIIICGYDGDVDFPKDWESFSWTANGGLANLGNNRGKLNSKREIIYFSPHCIKTS